jgi:hypothetical protein
MLIMIILVSIWALLMLRSGVAEYKYYQSVKIFEPEIWEKLGAPTFLKVPLVFVSTKGSKVLKGTSNKTVRALAIKHRQAGIQFLSYVVLVLVVSIVYFKIA